ALAVRRLAMNHLVPLLFLAAGPSFTSPDLSQRRLAAEAWSRRHGVAFSARAMNQVERRGAPCVRLRAPAAAGCSEVLELCSWEMGAGSCSGTWQEMKGLQRLDGGPAFELIDRAGWEPDPFECEQSRSMVWGLSDGGTIERPASGRDVEQCLRAERANAKAQETNVACDVLAVNPCLKEAYLSCRGRVNGARVSRTRAVSWADGGDELEWERPLVEPEDEADEDGG
ncbi:MAG: hypothetical protein SFW67_31255, partial [Myxococcaceae bacterium]|nr:hypothetical protein [Myxococcaceae bacterium]